MMALALLGSASSVMAQELDPLTVMEAYDLALRAKDVEGALALFADDAVLTTRQGQFVGKEQIRTWLERLVTQNASIEVANRQVSGDKVTWDNQFYRADLASLSNEPLEAKAEATIEAGKIKTFSSILTDDSQAKLDAATAAQQTETSSAEAPAVPAQLPATGAGYTFVLTVAAGLVGVGLFLLVIGLALRIRRRLA
jgi:hypothetical protein